MDYGQDVFLSQRDRWLPGVKSQVVVPSPAAGADWQVIVPGGQQWRILTGVATLTDGVAVANRVPGVRITDGSAQIFRFMSGASTAANDVFPIVYVEHDSPFAAAQGTGQLNAAYPGIWLPSGYTFGSVTTGLQAADQYSGISLYVEQLHVTDREISSVRERFEKLVG